MKIDIKNRKEDHLRIALEEDVQSSLSTGLENVQLIHCAVPEINLNDIDCSVDFFGKKIRAPIIISAMTGGTYNTKKINEDLAELAEKYGLAMCVGSQRIGLEYPDFMDTFCIRHKAPNIFLMSNIGVVQLNYGVGIDECIKCVDSIDADALTLHFNPLQEAIQKNGDTDFSGLLKKIESLCHSINVPIIAKEVGYGFSKQTIIDLMNAGISAFDLSSAGGASWSEIEKHRLCSEVDKRIASHFVDWGIPLAKNIVIADGIIKRSKPIIASGGIRTGIDIAKSIALGASICGMATPILKTLLISKEELDLFIYETIKTLEIAMFCTGSKNISELYGKDLK